MEDIKRHTTHDEQQEEGKASVDIWRYAFGFVDMAVVKCAIELKIPDAIENHNSQPVTLAELSSAVACSSPALLHRIMRFLAHQGIFKEQPTKHSLVGYTNAALSRRMISGRRDSKSLAPLILFEGSPVMLAPWLKLSRLVSAVDGCDPPFDAVHGEDIWGYAAKNPGHSELINEAVACDKRRVVPTVAGECGDLFEGIGGLVDVGGGIGEALGILVKAFPWIKGINFDLPHVVEVAKVFDGVENVGGDMFVSVPKADAIFLKSVLHDWSDEECIEILKRCIKAIPEKKGKVIILEVVVGEKKDDKFEFMRLMLDMVMMAHTSASKERTLKEWDYVLKRSGFVRYEVRDTSDVYSVIVAYLS